MVYNGCRARMDPKRPQAASDRTPQAARRRPSLRMRLVLTGRARRPAAAPAPTSLKLLNSGFLSESRLELELEYFDISSEDRKKLVVDLVKILAYSNNDYGSRDCFEYFMEHNMIDDIIKTIIDSTKNRYDVNRFPHTNRKFVLSCVSFSNKIKVVKPSAKIESIFEELKLNLCGLKRFFKMKEKDESKQT